MLDYACWLERTAGEVGGMFSGRAASDSDYVAVAVGLDCTSTLNRRLQGANSRWRGDRHCLIMGRVSVPLVSPIAELSVLNYSNALTCRLMAR